MNFQAESKKSGDEFEDIVQSDLVYRGFNILKRNFYITGAGCEVDFLAINDQLRLELVESKGGNPGEGKRPGAKRTDNVKKAIANGSLIKAVWPKSIYIVYFSAEPDPGGYSEEMINAAIKFNIIDEVRYLNPLQSMI